MLTKNLSGPVKRPLPRTSPSPNPPARAHHPTTRAEQPAAHDARLPRAFDPGPQRLQISAREEVPLAGFALPLRLPAGKLALRDRGCESRGASAGDRVVRRARGRRSPDFR